MPSRRHLIFAAILAISGIALALVIRARQPRPRESPRTPAAASAPTIPSEKSPARPAPGAPPQVVELADRTDLSVPEKIAALLTLAPSLNPDDRQSALVVTTELIPDLDFPKYRLRLLQLAETPELRDLVAHDALSRGEEIGLPVLLDVLRLASGDDERRDIRDLLEAYLDHDYGANADDWEQPVKTWLAEHADSP